jgi:hypothetical protein
MRILLTLCMGSIPLLLAGAQAVKPEDYRTQQRVVRSQWSGFVDKASAAARNCKGCGPGEAMGESVARVIARTYVSTANPPCGDPRMEGGKMLPEIKQSTASRFMSQQPPRYYALGIFEESAAFARPAISRVQQARQASPSNALATCTLLIVAIPKETRLTRVVKTIDCPARGWCGFGGEPTTEEINRDLLAVWVVAKNWSNNQIANATLQAFYRR